MMRDDWVEVELGEVCSIARGGSPRPIKEFITSENDGINWIKIGDTKDVSKYIRTVAEKIKHEGLSKTRLVKAGDLLLSNSMSFGRPYILKISGAIHDGWLVLSNREGFKLYTDYMYYVLSSPDVFCQFSRMATGSTVKNLNTGLVSKVIVKIPPIPEQRAIVAKIEKLLSELDNGIANFKTAKAKLEIFRQAVLKKAFEGELTREWRSQQPTFHSSGDLLKIDANLPSSWKLVNLDSICEHISDGDHQAPPKSNSGVPFITISNVDKKTYCIDFSNTFYVEEDYYFNIKSIRKPCIGDVLYTVTGSFGIPILITFDKKFCFQRHIALIRSSNFVNKKWLFYLLQSPAIFLQAKNTATGTAQKTVSLKSLRNFIVPLASKNEQHAIVGAIESRLSVCDKMTEIIDQSLEKAEALRQSILKKAFEGKLLSDDELAVCRREADWEPAQKLLERIREDKTVGGNKARTGKKRNT